MIGVDIDEELDRSAKENIERAAGRFRAAEVTSVTASVLEWPVPDDLSIVYMFNPFTGKTFHRPCSASSTPTIVSRAVAHHLRLPCGARLAGLQRACRRRERVGLLLASTSRLVAAGSGAYHIPGGRGGCGRVCSADARLAHPALTVHCSTGLRRMVSGSSPSKRTKEFITCRQPSNLMPEPVC